MLSLVRSELGTALGMVEESCRVAAAALSTSLSLVPPIHTSSGNFINGIFFFFSFLSSVLFMMLLLWFALTGFVPSGWILLGSWFSRT